MPRTARSSPTRWARVRSRPDQGRARHRRAGDPLRRGLGADRRRSGHGSRSPPSPTPCAPAPSRRSAPARAPTPRAGPPSSTPRRSTPNWPTRPREAHAGEPATCGELHPPAPYRGGSSLARRRARRRGGHDPQPGLRQLPGHGDRAGRCLAGAVLQLHGHADPRHAGGDRHARGGARRARGPGGQRAASRRCWRRSHERVRRRLSPLRHRPQPAGRAGMQDLLDGLRPRQGLRFPADRPRHALHRPARGLDLPHLRGREDAVPRADPTPARPPCWRRR
jgi:hypothetical protein